MAKEVVPEPEGRPGPEDAGHAPEEAGHAPEEATEYRPPPHSGARHIEVPQPEEILRRGFEPAEPDESLDTEDRGGLERSRRWRTGRPDPAADERPHED